MSYTIDLGYTRAVTTKNLAVPNTDSSAVWSQNTTAMSTDKNTLFAEYKSVTTARDRVATLKRWNRKIENIYKDGSVSLVYQSPVKTGNTVGWSMKAFYKVTSSDGESVYLPIYGEIRLDIPTHEAITGDVVLAFEKDLISNQLPLGSVSSNEIANQLNGGFSWLDETTP